MIAPQKEPHSFPLTDSGNAELIAELDGERLRFDHLQGIWLIWNGSYWVHDQDGEVYRIAKAAARARLRSAADLTSDLKRKEVVHWAIKSESQYRIEAALKLAKHTNPIADPGGNWDPDPLMFGVDNGVVDLRTGMLRPARPEDRITLRSLLSYEPSAVCPRFLQFLNELFLGEDETIRYVQKAIGYSLTGDIREQCLFLCFGEGANGKSTFLETIRYVVGSYAHNLPFSALELTARSGISNDIAGLVSKRYVTAAELSENVTLNEGRVKALTGGDLTTARRLYNDFFSFTPTMKFWLAVNHKPRVTDDTYGFWRRIRLIPFIARFDGVEQDKNLGAKLRAEATGILAWAFQGCRLWQVEGLEVPIAVQNATAAYQAESDWLTAFLQDQYELCPDGTVTCAQLNSDLKKWAAENGEVPPNARALASRLRKRGLIDARLSHGRTRAWRGMKPKVKCLSNLNADARTDVDTRIQ